MYILICNVLSEDDSSFVDAPASSGGNAMLLLLLPVPGVPSVSGLLLLPPGSGLLMLLPVLPLLSGEALLLVLPPPVFCMGCTCALASDCWLLFWTGSPARMRS